MTNVALGLVIASSVSAEAFGAFSVAFLTYVLLLGVSTSLVSEPLIVAARAADDAQAAREQAQAALGMAAVIGLIAAPVVAGTAILLGGPVAQCVVPMALLLPGLLLQDCLRHVFFAWGTPRAAAGVDVAWAALQALGFAAVLALAPHPSAQVLTAVWSVSAAIAAAIGLALAHLRPSIRMAPAWWHAHRRVGGSFAVDFLLMNGASQLGFYSVGVLAGLNSVGSLRGAALLMGPFRVLTAGSRILALPEGTKIRDASYERLVRSAAFLGALFVVGGLGWGAGVLLVPRWLGSGLLGDTWLGARDLLPVVVVAVTAGAVAGPPLYGLRILQDGRRLLRARRIDASLTVTLMVLGSAQAGASGAAIGWASANLLSAGLWWFQFSASHQSGPRSS